MSDHLHPYHVEHVNNMSAGECHKVIGPDGKPIGYYYGSDKAKHNASSLCSKLNAAYAAGFQAGRLPVPV